MDTRKRNAGLLAFGLSGLCAMSSGVVVSLLQEQYGFAYGVTGTLLAMMNIGNLTAGFVTGILPSRIGMKPTALLLTCGYTLGYGLMGFTSWQILLMLGFFWVGLAKGCTINLSTILVGDNSSDRTVGMNLMHACYACGALLCPFLISAAGRLGGTAPLFAIALGGVALWCVFLLTPLDGKGKAKQKTTDWGFLRSKKFWLLTGLIFCQNAAETSVSGWMVTYFKSSGLISAGFSPYTVTVMWGATLIARLLIAFVFPIKRACRAMMVMGAACTVFYFGLMSANSQLAAIALLFAFAFSMAGMNPTAVASAGKMTSVTSMGVMLPTASAGAILMPWIIGLVAERYGIVIGMATNLIPCAGTLILSFLADRLPEAE